MRQLPTDASKDLIELTARDEADEDSEDTAYLTTVHVTKQPVLLNFSDELGSNDLASAHQSAVQDAKAAVAIGSEYAVRKRERLFSGRHFTEHRRDGDQFFAYHRADVLFGPEL